MIKLPRRHFLAATGTMLAMTPVAALQQIALADIITRRSGDARQRVLVLYRENIALSLEFAVLSQQAGLPVLALTADPVRQWRDGVGALAIADDWRLAGMSNWIDYTILRGLAAEDRRFPLLMLQHNRQQLQQTGIASQTAALLALAQEADADEITRKKALLIDNSLNINHRPGLFSWVI